MDGAQLPPIPQLTLFPGTERQDVDAVAITKGWMSRLDSLLTTRNFNDLNELIIDDGWWRDILGLDWDFTSKQGLGAIAEYLTGAPNPLSGLQCDEAGGLKPLLIELGGGVSFKTPFGEGRGFVRLVNVGPAVWKAWIVFTQLEQLAFQKTLEEQRIRHPSAAPRKATDGVANLPQAGHEEDVPVVIVGAGQAGLMLGARLASMGIRPLLLEKGPRVGDSWRKRYRKVTLHTPTYTDHYPFMKIPETWPRWLRSDDISRFMEAYSSLMGLDIRTGCTVTGVDFDETTRRYRVRSLTDQGTELTYYPHHVVMATGTFNEEPIVPDLAGRDLFHGPIYHSSQHVSADQISDLRDKKVVVVGASTSGHDVAQDFVECGAKGVSMIQRNPIFSISAAAFEEQVIGLWNMPGVTTEEADLVGNSIPLAVIRTMSIGMTQSMYAKDKEMVDGLRKAGLAVRTGEDGFGLADHQLIKGGRFYIDQGASQMIVDGRIKIHRCEEGVREFREKSVVLADGTEVEADVVVLATGFQPCVRSVEQVMGAEVAKKLDNLGDLDHENERIGWWRPTGIPGFWYMTGSFLWCRQFSMTLALQIAAIEKGLNPSHYTRSA
ncbi:Monooxygenase [Apiospora arundinis]